MIQAIFVAKKAKQAQIEIEAVKVDAGKGIVGDRYYGKKGNDGPNITFVALEEIHAFNENFEQRITLSDTRRNVVTYGVSLNDLVGKRFRIGDAEFYGVELCEPCALLGKRLATEEMSAAQVVKAWLHKGGLRADVVRSGVLRVGMPIEQLD
ncbi:MOSC domain-containing protein [Marinomonas posidonica]|uniref:MOSC domain-containing protein n=1 Tax=Marinomonas posidonica TaxID=936476 RepID=UPI0037362FCD